MALQEIPVKVIGVVKNEMKETGGRSNIQDIISEVVLDDSLDGAIDSLDEYSHVTILYWCHVDRNPGEKPNKLHPHRQEKYPLVGVFATRSSDRPNRFGICTAKLLECKGTVLKVAGLDAIDGSPLINIFPYNPHHDSRPDATMPEWS